MRIVFGLWVVLIVCLSLVPLKTKFHFGTTGRWHNAGHVFMFFVATLLACRLFSGFYAKLLGCVGVLGIALMMEWVEMVSYHIPYEWSDIRVDGIGILCGTLLMLLPPAISSSSVKHTA
jgi:hypothetical protein